MNPKYAQQFNELNERLGNLENFQDEESSSMSELDDQRYIIEPHEPHESHTYTYSSFSNFVVNDEHMEAEQERPSLKLKLTLKPSNFPVCQLSLLVLAETVKQIAKEKRRRGRPRRTAALPVNDIETEDQFCNFNNENIESEEFIESEDENPDHVLEDGGETTDEDSDQATPHTYNWIMLASMF